jgi:hypothetical protein
MFIAIIFMPTFNFATYKQWHGNNINGISSKSITLMMPGPEIYTHDLQMPTSFKHFIIHTWVGFLSHPIFSILWL